MRATRLLAILIMLQLRGRMTAEALAAEYEVSLRTLYRDIDALSAAGVPVYGDRGPGGGFQLHEGYRTRLTGLTPAEAAAMLLGGMPGAATDLGLADEAGMARRKLLAAISPELAETAARTIDRLHIDPVEWYQRRAAPPHLQMIAQAVWGGARLRLRYQSWTSATERSVDPLGLVLKAGSWYLVARHKKRTLTYKLASIVEATPLASTFADPASFDLARYWAKSVARFEQELRRDEAVLKVAPGAISRLDRLGADMAESIRAALPDDEGWRKTTVPIEGIAHAASLLLGFADDILVLSPPALRAALADGAQRVLALYRKERRADKLPARD
jgi:predicted DNA-binding transcriptional regulator YafY